MKVLRRVVVLFLLALLSCPLVVAQNSTSHTVRKQVSALLAKHKDEKGVMAMESDGGVKLQAVKMMLRKEFGQEFSDAVKAFAIIFYKDASAENVGKIVGGINQITKPLREINIQDRMKKGERARGYVRLSDNQQKITDLMIVVQAPSPKLIYISGEFDAAGTNIKR